MNARGSTEVIIATIGLSMGVLSQNLFSMIVMMAIITTMAMPPMLRGALSRLPLRQDEKARLEREEFEQNDFVANLERLLLAVDEGANAKFASRIAGLLAGTRGLPITVLHVGARAKQQEGSRENGESHETVVKEAATAIAEVDQESVGNVEITTRTPARETADAVVEEARKGFDLLVVGVENVMSKDGFDKKVEDVTSGFKGPVALVAAKGVHLKQPASAEFRILVAASGSAVSRRGAEIAGALARSSPDPLRVVYVSTTRGKGARRRGASMSLASEEGILKDAAAAAARYDVDVRTTLRANAAPEEGILQEIETSGADLVVLGGDRIKGKSLNFGGVATAILSKSRVSVLLIADGEANRKD
jgi:nucleotide-binding universal stress UspA family protein